MLGALVVAMTCLVLLAPAADAAYVEVGAFAGGGSGPGGSGSEDGQLSNPGQADVNDATGNLYVADTANNRVQVFKPTATGGEYDSQVTIAEPTGLAIDQDTGDVYVATATGIAKFTSVLAPIGGAGWTDPAVTGTLAVEPSSGDLLVADQGADLVRRFDSDGSADGTFAAARPLDLAADSSGDVLVVTSTGDLISDCAAESAVRRFSGAGVEEAVVGAGLSSPGAVAVDPDDDSVVVASRTNQYNCGPETPLVSFFGADGTELESIALSADTQYATVPGLAARGAGSSRVYAVTRSPMNDIFGATKITVLEIPPPALPQVLGQSVLRGATDATLRATIDAGGLATEYHFEYGTSAAYGEQTARGSLPASFGKAPVSAAIAGLAPGTTYHYRVVAENSLGEAAGPDRTFTTFAGTSCPNEAFRTGASALLTDCRAFELVTPTNSRADIRVAGGPVTPDGETACFNSENSLAGSAPNGIKTADDGFCAWRTSDGWETKWVTGPAPVEQISSMGSNVYFLSPDGRRVVFASDSVLFGHDYEPPAGAAHGSNVSAYMWEADETTWLAPAGSGAGSPPAYEKEPLGLTPERRPLAVSADLTHGLFMSGMPIVPADENHVIDVYEWHPGGVRLVSSDPSGKAAGGNAGIRPDAGIQMVAPPGAISADGSRIFFQHGGAPLVGDASEAPEGPDEEDFGIPIQSVYMREGDELTLVSPRRGSGPAASVWFVGAAADGESAYLETSQQLTPDAKQSGRAIYRYDVAADQLELIADAPGGVRFLTLSPDGSTIVYREQLSNALVVERDGVASTLGTFASSDLDTEQGAGNPRVDQRMLRVTPDGRVVVFAAAGEFAGFGPGPIQVYRWEAGAGLERISAEDGAEAEIGASIGAYAGTILSEREELFAAHTSRAGSGRVISEDGSRVFFETPEALVNRDVNGVTDVYEWHSGEIDLVSSGTGEKALYHGSSADGRTVFITTFNRLLPGWDRNSRRDLYVARPGGGFAPPPLPPGCQGEGCQPGRAAPSASSVGTAAGKGNLQRGLGAATIARRGRAIRVEVLMPGHVTATLSGKLGKSRTVRVARASKLAREAGDLILPLTLSRKGRDLLRERGRLRLTLTVKHAQSDQTVTRKVTLHD